MSKNDSSSDKKKGPEGLAGDTDSKQITGSDEGLEIEASGEDKISPAVEDDKSSEDETSPALEIEVSGEDETSPVVGDDGSSDTETPLKAESEESGEAETPPETKPDQSAPSKPRRSWFGFFNFLLILLLAGAAGSV